MDLTLLKNVKSNEIKINPRSVGYIPAKQLSEINMDIHKKLQIREIILVVIVVSMYLAERVALIQISSLVKLYGGGGRGWGRDELHTNTLHVYLQ